MSNQFENSLSKIVCAYKPYLTYINDRFKQITEYSGVFPENWFGDAYYNQKGELFIFKQGKGYIIAYK